MIKCDRGFQLVILNNTKHFSMKSILALSICLVALASQAQPSSDFISKGDSLYAEGNYEASGKAYGQAFKLSEGNASQYYNAACSWSLAGNLTQSFKYLNLSADKGWSNVAHLKTDGDLANLRAMDKWQLIIDKVQANKDENEKNFNRPLQTQLEDILVRDQTLRQLYKEAQDKFGKDSKEMDFFWSLMAKQDSICEVEVVNIIEKHGWVGKSVVGNNGNLALWLVIQHAPLETQEKYLPLLKASVMQGESNGGHLALLEDRILMRNDKSQTYGSQFKFDEKKGANVFFEIADPKHVNKRRQEVGLGPIEEYAQRNNIEWGIEQEY
jgi:tetratricopeptide (TPR) repeat protein